MKLSREVKTAIIVLGGILLFIMGFSFLKSSSIFDSSRTFYAVYGNVGGLEPATPVTINGLTVGKIQSIRFKDTSGKLLVTFTVESDFVFSKNSKAELYDTGIIGGKSIQIIPVFDESGPAVEGDTLQATIRPGLTELVTQKLTPLQEKVQLAITSADSLLGGVNQVLDDKTRKNLQSAIGGLNDVIYNFKKTSNALNALLDENRKNLDNSLTNLNKITDNFSSISDTLAQSNLGTTVKKLQTTVASLDKVLAQVENGEGTLGKLLKDESMYKNLTDASKQLDLLLEDLRLNPKRYVHISVFGKKAKEYQPPAEEEDNK